MELFRIVQPFAFLPHLEMSRVAVAELPTQEPFEHLDCDLLRYAEVFFSKTINMPLVVVLA